MVESQPCLSLIDSFSEDSCNFFETEVFSVEKNFAKIQELAGIIIENPIAVLIITWALVICCADLLDKSDVFKNIFVDEVSSLLRIIVGDSCYVL